ncbi:nucleoside-diphosphate sugar epimerase/dehydratase [Jannaschia sp. M317]|uniref:polysaccharide biosynthesis protein n=1 Tax=Jannaschia sp. M317 TaxID=2867011 RepID=UPI0021A50F5A|nr:nucleoside-diphosphate sugar epimerase/dehydratase [Jannaschia sp. M317]UWQ18156.1 polysaccharide biosynthesis protein [Jannaschia sp. M317]
MLKLLNGLTRRQKSSVFFALDLIIICTALAFTLAVQPLPGDAPDVQSFLIVGIPYVGLLGGALLILLEIPNMRLADFDGPSMGRIAAMSIFLTAATTVLTLLLGSSLPIQFHLMFGISVFMFMTVTRVILLQVVLAIYRRGEKVCRVLIYGAGTTGTQLVQAFRAHHDIDPVAFVDDNHALQGLTISGLPVMTPVRIQEIVKQRRIDRVLLAIPSLSPPAQAQIARRLQKMGLEVQTLPSFSQLIGQEALIDKLQTVNPQAFLNRPEVETPLGEGTDSYKGKTVLVSGAGGSIGSELCRQLLECRPKKLILFELSEFALFTVEQELRTLATDAGVEVSLVLGSVTDPRQVRHVLATHGVQVVLHAAAYKHVSLVQQNPLAGIANNILGTHTLATAAVAAGVERFTLISSDKAVRPKGVMGASKRFAEMVIQDLASRVPDGEGPVFSMVRFGNVLGSSGSVVPIFHEQIQKGGPVTVTHPHVKRFFMTIQEAARLVLKAGAMAEGGEVFLLDMGEPVSIFKLATQAIEATGYSVKSEANPDGDIEIKFIGLREGEKLEEELFLDGSEKPTAHRKIFRVRERSLSEIEMASSLRGLRSALASGDSDRALDIIASRISSFRAQPQEEPESVTTLH